MKVSERLTVLERPEAPRQLRRRLLDSLDAEDGAQVWPRRFTSLLTWGAYATAVTALIVVATPSRTGPEFARPLVQHAVIGLDAEQALETADRAALRSWLQSQLGYAVEVPAISKASLLGGSVVHLSGIPTPAVTYNMGGELLTYFALPTAHFPGGTQALHGTSTQSTTRGYHIVTWKEFGEVRAVVGTVDPEDLLAVAEECQRKAARASL